MSLPCRDAPFCSAGAWGEWVASAQTPIRSAAPRPLMEVTDPWVVPSLGRLTLQCPQKHHEARAPLSSGAQSRGSPTPKASARPRTDLSASASSVCIQCQSPIPALAQSCFLRQDTFLGVWEGH